MPDELTSDRGCARPSRGAAEGEHPLLDCVFVFSPSELRCAQPGWVYLDQQSDVFTARLVAACLPDGALRGVSSDITTLGSQYVYLDGPTWERNVAQLRAAGVHGQRARVLLHFDYDPTGFWDYAKACGPELRTAFATGQVPIHALSAYLEQWAESRTIGDRVLPAFGYNVRDYRELIDSNAGSVLKVLAGLADDESRATYTRMLLGSNEQVLAAFGRRVFGSQQYMEIAAIRPGDHIVNCGVGRGWELPFFLARLRGKGIVYNCDPVIGYQFFLYKDFIRHFQENLRDHRIIVGDTDGEVALHTDSWHMVHSSDLARESGAASATAQVFQSRTLDNLVHTGEVLRIDFIKLDVEGGELSALRGAMSAIRRFRPRLAVAIYHEPDHFWRYPAELMERLDGYRFYIRQYGFSRFETLLYAVPEEDGESCSGSETLVSVRSAGTLRGRIHVHLLNAGAPRGFGGTPGGFEGATASLVTRCVGTSWSTASLTPGPRVHVDRVAAIIEHGGGRLYIAEHEDQDNRCVVLGDEAPGEVRWHIQKGLDQRQIIPTFGFRLDETAFGEYDPQTGLLDLYGVANGLAIGRTRVACTSRPLFISRTGTVTHLVTQPAPGHVSVCRIDGLTADPAGLTVNVSGDVAGCTTLEEFGAEGTRFSPAVLVHHPGELVLSVHVLRPDGSMDCAGNVDLGGTRLAPTVIIPDSSCELTPSEPAGEAVGESLGSARRVVGRTISGWRRFGQRYAHRRLRDRQPH